LPDNGQLPVQAVNDPVLSSPYEEPREHWTYREGIPNRTPGRRPASYYYTTQTLGGTAQKDLFAEEQRVDLPLVNRLRADVGRWRQSNYRGASRVTTELMAWWRREDRPRRLFFCQLEAAETLIYLLELRLQRLTSRTGFQRFELSDDDLNHLLQGELPAFEEIRGLAGTLLTHPSLIDRPADADLLPLLRLGCKMATGSGKTVVMAMLIAWAFCNRGRNPASTAFPRGVLVCCPNLTVKERLQVLRPDMAGNYYDEFEIVPGKYREFLTTGRVLVTNWHVFAPRSPHREGDASFRVVDKGEETNDAFALNRLGELASRLPILVMNDEGHHCWRPKAASEEETALKGLSAEEKEVLEQEEEEARVWLAGLDRINNGGLIGPKKPCILATVDLSATPFHLAASGHSAGSPFPWLVSDFGLVDAIESGIVKIPRLPVKDDTENKDDAGRPDPKYFRLWKHVCDALPPGQFKQNGKPKPEAVYKEAQGALLTLAAQWKKRFDDVKAAKPTEEAIPPVLIVVCDNTEIAEVFFREISGERVEEVVVKEGKKAGETAKHTVHGESAVLAEFANTESGRYTIHIDSRMLNKLDVEEGSNKDKAAEDLRQVIATVGKRGRPGEHVRCVVSVSMLTEGWDASNVTHILGVRAFDSQLLCEQVVGRGLRRMNYSPDRETGRLRPEHVDVYGIPFSLIPFKSQPKEDDPEEQIRNHVFAVPEKKHFEMRLPMVESYVYALRQDGIRCDVESLEGFTVDQEPTAVFVVPTRGYNEDPSRVRTADWEEQDRTAFYETVHFQSILFRLTQMILDQLVQGSQGDEKEKAWVRLQARHLVFPQLYRTVSEYVERKVTFKPGVDKRELALRRYAEKLVTQIRDNILPAAAASETPLLPILNSFNPYVSTRTVDYTTTRPVVPLTKSHLNAAAIYSKEEGWAIDLFEDWDPVEAFAPNERRIGLAIPYEYQDIQRQYVPDFIVRMRDGSAGPEKRPGRTVLIEIKGYGGEMHDVNLVQAKTAAARKWVAALNNLGQFGKWEFEICHAREGDSAWGFKTRLKETLKKHAPEAAPEPFRRVRPTPAERWVTCVPLVTLKAAAGEFSEEQVQGELPLTDDTEWVAFESSHRFADGMFVAQVRGRSMEPKIPDGSWCLFRRAPQGARNGRILLVASHEIHDSEHPGRYTLKVYESEKAVGDGSWRHTRIILKAINPDFDPIVLTPESEDAVRVVGEFVEVVGARKNLADLT